MISNEKDLDRVLAKELNKFGNAHKIENRIGVGMADFYFENDISAIWIENKIIDTPVENIKFEPGQVTFLSEYHSIYGKYLLLYIKSEKSFYLYRGNTSLLIRDNKVHKVLDLYLLKSDSIKELVKWLLRK